MFLLDFLKENLTFSTLHVVPLVIPMINSKIIQNVGSDGITCTRKSVTNENASFISLQAS